MSERNGVEIDYCPDCRGVWLDRGELDKIIDRVDAAPAQAAHSQQVPPVYEQRDSRQQGYTQQPQKRRKENWLSELFE
jgi:Zn-finger nucleic acid-binding protein